MGDLPVEAPGRGDVAGLRECRNVVALSQEGGDDRLVADRQVCRIRSGTLHVEEGPELGELTGSNLYRRPRSGHSFAPEGSVAGTVGDALEADGARALAHRISLCLVLTGAGED